MIAAYQGLPKVTSKNSLDMYIPTDSEQQTDLRKNQDLGETGIPAKFFILNEETDYKSLMVQLQMIDIGEKTKEWKFQWGNQYSWQDDLNQWVSKGNCIDSGTPVALVSGLVPPEKFYMCLHALKSVNTQVGSAITFKEDNTIKNSSISFKQKRPEAQDMVEVMDYTYTLASQGPQGTMGQSHDFVSTFALERVLYTELLQFLLASGGCIMAVIHLVFNNILGTLIVTTCIINIMIIVQSAIQYFNLYLNSITLIFLIMSLGISVDQSAHIMHAFLECRGWREQRVERALTDMGPAILHAALSTFLGVCFTILGAGFVWKAFFTIWSTVVVTGFIQSTIVLPVLLTLIGPENLHKFDNDLFNQAITDENLSSIKNVFVEYSNLKNLQEENDLKTQEKKKRELLKKIHHLNQEHIISFISRYFDVTTVASFDKIENKSNNSQSNSKFNQHTPNNSILNQNISNLKYLDYVNQLNQENQIHQKKLDI